MLPFSGERNGYLIKNMFDSTLLYCPEHSHTQEKLSAVSPKEGISENLNVKA